MKKNLKLTLIIGIMIITFSIANISYADELTTNSTTEETTATEDSQETNSTTKSTEESQRTKSTSLPTSLDDIIINGKKFLQSGSTNVIEETELKSLSDLVSGILLWIAVAVTLITAIIMGITFLTQSIEDKAKVKESMTPWVIGIIISFSAYTIWKITIAVFSSL